MEFYVQNIGQDQSQPTTVALNVVLLDEKPGLSIIDCVAWYSTLPPEIWLVASIVLADCTTVPEVIG